MKENTIRFFCTIGVVSLFLVAISYAAQVTDTSTATIWAQTPKQLLSIANPQTATITSTANGFSIVIPYTLPILDKANSKYIYQNTTTFFTVTNDQINTCIAMQAKKNANVAKKKCIDILFTGQIKAKKNIVSMQVMKRIQSDKITANKTPTSPPVTLSDAQNIG